MSSADGAGDVAAFGPLVTLMDSVIGRYTVRTESSSYLVDLDAMTFTRAPREDDPTASQLRKDRETVDLLQIVQCTVGEEMILALNLHAPGVQFTVRQTTFVQSIDSLPSADACLDEDAQTEAAT